MSILTVEALEGYAGRPRVTPSRPACDTLARVDRDHLNTTKPTADLRAVLAATGADIAPAALSKGAEIVLGESDRLPIRGDSALLHILFRKVLENVGAHLRTRKSGRVSSGKVPAHTWSFTDCEGWRGSKSPAGARRRWRS